MASWFFKNINLFNNDKLDDKRRIAFFGLLNYIETNLAKRLNTDEQYRANATRLRRIIPEHTSQLSIKKKYPILFNWFANTKTSYRKNKLSGEKLRIIEELINLSIKHWT
jgi:hypothetical protein